MIQKKGLVVLQMFASCRRQHVEEYQARIVSLIHAALQHFANVKSIQTEVSTSKIYVTEATTNILK